MHSRVTFSGHAIIRMFEREIGSDEVLEVIDKGDAIEEYPDDTPYTSKLLSGCYNERPIHGVVARNEAENETIVITVYEPDPEKWESEFTRRRV